jgi:hypothetical protein
MTLVVKTLDLVPGTGTSEGPRLTFKVGQITAREIIRARIKADVDRYNSAEAPPTRIGLVVPPPEERALNGPYRERRRVLDVESQIAVALTAVRARKVIILFNGEQVEDVDAPLNVTPVSEVQFLRLVQLVGG